MLSDLELVCFAFSYFLFISSFSAASFAFANSSFLFLNCTFTVVVVFIAYFSPVASFSCITISYFFVFFLSSVLLTVILALLFTYSALIPSYKPEISMVMSSPSLSNALGVVYSIIGSPWIDPSSSMT